MDIFHFEQAMTQKLASSQITPTAMRTAALLAASKLRGNDLLVNSNFGAPFSGANPSLSTTSLPTYSDPTAAILEQELRAIAQARVQSATSHQSSLLQQFLAFKAGSLGNTLPSISLSDVSVSPTAAGAGVQARPGITATAGAATGVGGFGMLNSKAYCEDACGSTKKRRGGVSDPFPCKLHRVLSQLEAEGKSDIMSFLPHGRAFAIHKPKEFVSKVMPKYFRMSSLASFQRQLNLYKFKRITEGRDKGSYYHTLFLKGKPELCKDLRRSKSKRVFLSGPMITGNALMGYYAEPNFYNMPPILNENQGVLSSSLQELLVRGKAASAPAASLASPVLTQNL